MFRKQFNKDLKKAKVYEELFSLYLKKRGKEVEVYDDPEQMFISVNGKIMNGVSSHFPDVGCWEGNDLHLFDVKVTGMKQMPLERDVVNASVKWNAPVVWFFKNLRKCYVIPPCWVSKYYARQSGREVSALSKEGATKLANGGKGNPGIVLELYEFDEFYNEDLTAFYNKAVGLGLVD
jgi:hypothetical protein